MLSIHKFTFQLSDEPVVMMPVNAKILCVQTQNGIPCIWAMVDPSDEIFGRTLRLFGTGHPIPDDFTGNYIGTFQTPMGLVFHLFQ